VLVEPVGVFEQVEGGEPDAPAGVEVVGGVVELPLDALFALPGGA
jgi:hypothetical protein